MARIFLTSIFLLLILFSSSQNSFEGYENLLSEVRNYQVYQTISEIIIDGKVNEISWQKATWSEDFQDIEGGIKPAPTFRTRFKMLWDEQNLYILAELEEPDIWAYYIKRDQIVYHENDFEIFIDPDGDTHNYFEFELNAQNNLFDLFMPKPYRNGGNFDIGWNATDLKSAVFVDGTLNNPSDSDTKWTIEMAIPFSSLKLNEQFKIPEDGDFWKINFSRVEWKTEIVNGKYQKRKDAKTNRFIPENNWVWSKQGIINMHYPERWGIAVFSGKKVSNDTENYELPEIELLGKYLWLIYYKQQNYKKENGKYATLLYDIGLTEKLVTETGENIYLRMEESKSGFNAFLDYKNGLRLSINENGLFKKEKSNNNE